MRSSRCINECISDGSRFVESSSSSLSTKVTRSSAFLDVVSYRIALQEAKVRKETLALLCPLLVGVQHLALRC